ncbi:cytochrome C oxidase subunit IV family protein [Marinobacter fonticola]|uniref:oxidase n=1 Tax=Marinobacter fonticola TaxID=2603215 RepID=UPI0011E73B6B|nr:oxidase [Marinobacter fonticola]
MPSKMNYMNYRPMLLTWIGLLILLGVSVLGASMTSGVLQLVISLTCAALMAALVMTFFMRLRSAEALIRLYALGGFLWLGFLILMTMADYLTR